MATGGEPMEVEAEEEEVQQEEGKDGMQPLIKFCDDCLSVSI